MTSRCSREPWAEPGSQLGPPLTPGGGASGGVCHPWLFIEEVAHKEVERDYNSVYSRLVLCKTYRLDEDGKVLSPEEVGAAATAPAAGRLLFHF